jgi:multicomponent K+:H+ antiporter subunit C
MELALASLIGTLVAAGVYLLLRARSFDVILGLTLLSYAVNLLIFSMGRLVVGKPPLLRDGVAPTLANHVDPLPQALVLTAIVISFGMTAVLVMVGLGAYLEAGDDRINMDAREEPKDDEERAA